MGYTEALLAIFPVLFTSYLSFFIPALAQGPGGLPAAAGAVVHWLLSVLVIVTAMVVNLRGAWEVGRSAQVGAAVVLGAFVLLLVVWLVRDPAPSNAVGIVVRDLAGDHHGALLLGLSIVLLNYGGWDGAATYAGEVARPQRNYPLAIGLALLAVTLCYLLPVLAGVSVTISPTIWNADPGAGWPVIARLIGGRWLAGLLAGAGLVSMWTLFNAQLLYVSRLPYVMACDGWLPALFARTSARTAVPTAAIVMFCGFATAFAALSFGSLSVIVCLLTIAGLVLEFLSLIVLRIRRPDAVRPFRVPGGWVGLGLVCLTPLAAAVLVLVATMRDWRSYPGQIFIVAMIVVSGVALYPIRSRANRARGKPASAP